MINKESEVQKVRFKYVGEGEVKEQCIEEENIITDDMPRYKQEYQKLEFAHYNRNWLQFAQGYK